MSEVRLVGYLRCRNGSEAKLVMAHLPAHIALTRAEPGCISFEVNPTANTLVWKVEERFVNSDAFRAHQARVAVSEWGKATSELARDYTVTGLSE